MRGLLLPASLLCAMAATLLLAYVALRNDEGTATTAADGATPANRGADARVVPMLRPYQTTVTLTEDLRDALASGDGAFVASECWRVSDALRGKARWTLQNVAAQEASPRVRALLVLANGVHVPDERALLDFLRDRAPVVRRATALATAYDPDGKRRLPLVAGLDVPAGRALPDATRAALERRLEHEDDAEVREALQAALGGA